MATTSTSDFALPIDELLSEASDRIGAGPVLGNEARTSRRTLDLLFTDLQNRGVMLFTLQQTTVAMTSGTQSYALSANTVDWLEAVLVRTSLATQLGRIGYQEYLQLPDKTQTGRPSEFFLQRGRDTPTLFPWPVPDNSTDKIIGWKVRKTYDSSALSNDPDAPRRYWPSLVSGLSYYLALKRPNLPIERILMLKSLYEEELDRAMSEDRERVSLRLVPGRSR